MQQHSHREVVDFDSPLVTKISSSIGTNRCARLPGYFRPSVGIPSDRAVAQTGRWVVEALDGATAQSLFESGALPTAISTLPLIRGVNPFDLLPQDQFFHSAFDIMWLNLQHLNGLCLGGGGDIYAGWYGHTPHPQAGMFELWRDFWEIGHALLAWAILMPTLAICRGTQIINIALGGDLYQDLRTDWPRQNPPLLRHGRYGRVTWDNMLVHPVEILTPRFSRLVNGDSRAPRRQFIDLVKSQHHQAVRRLAPGLQVEITSPEGVTEGIADPSPNRFFIGVQFHPEYDFDQAWSRNLFAAFSEACFTYATLTHASLETLEPHREEICLWLRQRMLFPLLGHLPSVQRDECGTCPETGGWAIQQEGAPYHHIASGRDTPVTDDLLIEPLQLDQQTEYSLPFAQHTKAASAGEEYRHGR